MLRKVNDLSPVWLHWRRAWLEDSRRRIFNVVAEHVCWLDDTNLVTLNSRQGIYGCAACGRLHECLGNAASCPVRQNRDDQSYACAFSGRQVGDADAVIGVWELEQMARQPAHISASSAIIWMQTTQKKQHIKLGNLSSNTQQRNREFKRAEEAESLQKAAITCRALSKAAGITEENEETSHMHDDDEEIALPVGGGDDEDNECDAEDLVAINGLLDDASRNVLYDADERVRDFEYQRRLFAPLVARLAHLAPRFARTPPPPLEVTPTPLPPPTVAPSPTLNQVNARAQKAMAATRMLEQVLATVIPLFELVTSRPVTAPTVDERVGYYAPIVQRLIELSQGKPMHLLATGDMEQRIVVVLMDLLASPLRLRDSEGNLLFAWVADPWLAWCKREGHLVQLLLKYLTWKKVAGNTHDGRLTGPSRKRKRSESNGAEERPSPSVCPISGPAAAAMAKLSVTLSKAIQTAATNISHHGNEMRNALLSLEQAPISLFALVHADLFRSKLNETTRK